MLRKIVCMVLVSVLMLNAFLAFAEYPSPVLPVVIHGEITDENGAVINSDIVMAIKSLPEQAANDSKLTTNLEITEEAIVALFDDEMMEKVSEVSQAIKAEDKLAILELATISVEADSKGEIDQDVEVCFQLAVEYDEESPTVVIIGVQDEDGNVKWVPVESLLVDGKLVVKINKELLKSLVVSDMSYIVLLQKTEE